MHLHVLAHSAKCHEVIRFLRGLVLVVFVVPQALTTGFTQSLKVFASLGWWCCRASCPQMLVDTLGTNCDQRRSNVQCCFTSTETVRLIRTESSGRPPRLSHCSSTLKWKFGKNGISFSRPWKVFENWVGTVKVCEFCGPPSARGKISAYQSETALP